MLCQKLEKIEDLPKDYIIQHKLDGSRALYINGKFLGRKRRNSNSSDYFKTMNIGHIKEALKNKDVVLDGELCVFKDGLSHLNLLLQKKEQPNAVFVVFDILHLDGRDLTKLPFRERFKILKRWYYDLCEYSAITILNYCEFSQEVIDNWYTFGYEGIVAKKIDSPYIIDWNNPLEEMRTPFWLKFKFWKTMEVEIKKFKPSKSGIHSHGALETSHGDVGLLTIENRDFYLNNKPIKAKIRYLELTDRGVMRKPVLMGFL
jgi:bifunctional non-homologous end joining protein LigD